MKSIEELAVEAGINTKFWNMGAGSVLFVSFVDGIPRSNFEHYTALVREQASEWQPIETAPKDAQSVLLGCIGQLGSVTRCADGYWLQSAYNGNGAWIWPFVHKSPTHWMPLPAPPKSTCESA